MKHKVASCVKSRLSGNTRGGGRSRFICAASTGGELGLRMIALLRGLCVFLSFTTNIHPLFQRSGTKQKKKRKAAHKESHPEPKDNLQANKSQPGLQQPKAQSVQLTVTKKKSAEGTENSAQPVAKVVLSKVPPQQATKPQSQEAQLAQGSAGQKKKKKKKKKPKQQVEHQAAESVPEKPAETHESGCCKLRNLKEITCLELICPHSSKPAGKAFSPQGPNAGASASPSSKPSQPAASTNALTQNHLDSLSDAIVKSLASLDKSSISITLVNTKDESTVGEKIVRALQEPLPGPNPEIVVDICGTSVIDFGKKDSEIGCSAVLQNSDVKMPSGDGGDSKKSSKKNKDSGAAKAVNSHVVTNSDKHPQKADDKATKIIKKQTDAKPVVVLTSTTSVVQAKRENDGAVNKDAATNDAAQGNAVGEKSKAELKAQRRALQEAQRAAKAQAATENSNKPAEQAPATAKQTAAVSSSHHPAAKKVDGESKQEQGPHSQEAPTKKTTRKAAPEGKQHEVLRLFSHLHQNPGTVKECLVEWIGKFVHEEICLAKRQITVEAQQKIMDEDVILTYCCSSLVKSVLKLAHESGKNFRVIVVDSRPQFRGREMLEYLSSAGISCTYVFITAVSYIMKEVTKVVLGASTLLANGYVMGHIGTSQIALVAKSRNVPVLVCCETYKFSDRVITDSFALNELGPTSQLVSSLPASVKTDGLKDLPSLSFLNLMYDVTAPQFVDMVITEKGILPCTSVPVVLRMRNAAYQ
ncbi:hypothetical protein HPB50_010036 [Hyalomma asiaticum]|uniref:Uncharacterized protein n=1 Tax=Hyalomma asiaticum TaxID=266040 RepID=A0ACB7S0E6_HYAAI|nr:hypothetical protein HPB50_010036 [Hyalomma asiaticum]